jgi:hypothetical protein
MGNFSPRLTHIINIIMMKKLLVISLLFLFSCGSNSPKENKKNVPTDNLLQENSINNLVTSNHLKFSGMKGDFQSFKLYLDKLVNDSLTSIPYALDYINACISIDNADRDSIFLLFNIKFYSVANRLSDSLYTKYKSIVELLDKDSSTAELRNFKNNLKLCGIDIFSTEGMYYLDVIPDFFYNNFKNRVSEGVVEYLNIRKDELKQGFSEDAGMLISFEDLYGRIKRWENFINKYPNTLYNSDANSYYSTYLETLMTGMDNSRIFDFDSNSLTPEIKSLYETIIKEDIESPTTKIISSYYDFLARHDFKENDSIQIFLKTNNLSTMLSVQPQTR